MQNPPPVGWGADAVAQVVVAYTPQSGICALESTGPPWNLKFCDQLIECKPQLTITIDVLEFVAGHDVIFSGSAAGTICNLGHDDARFAAEVDFSHTFAVFDKVIGMPCGSDCGVDATYDIQAGYSDAGVQLLTPDNPAGPNAPQSSSNRLTFSADMSCTACSDVIIE